MSAESADGSRRLRVLCLHGLYQSGPGMEETVNNSSFGQESIKSRFEFVSVSAPPPVLQMLGAGGDYRRWWTSFGGVYYPGQPLIGEPFRDVKVLKQGYGTEEEIVTGILNEEMDETFKFLKDLIETRGPFDGVLGFSMGGFLTSILVPLQLLQQRDGELKKRVEARFNLNRNSADDEISQRCVERTLQAALALAPVLDFKFGVICSGAPNYDVFCRELNLHPQFKSAHEPCSHSTPGTSYAPESVPKDLPKDEMAYPEPFPLLVTADENDFIVPFADTEQLCGLFANTTFLKVSGHSLPTLAHECNTQVVDWMKDRSTS
ncbi:hypothetical protein EMIHUDRAFT_199459 [Emiliania huxleyi CCMP1516]|uniref:Serine hydrolase domain-containing protein n=2 Tax=Emiliania huxleyi TaxID=2903 RepID=A0A0D3KZM7_EMIH1|nr:hypothetical protein EMIHUDRAFT_199459 [Emiliania huxleyi CCMP1516]EOD41212.1 hypothetical protein EMIHUDRAFT_199459 [Emiliania huxleyi CCMP1516]|eukprot:XP_005793641.1 hypothetical protein EMIHUDRAFT_199459 [Emiliania huxleyi CCMP1516]